MSGTEPERSAGTAPTYRRGTIAAEREAHGPAGLRRPRSPVASALKQLGSVVAGGLGAGALGLGLLLLSAIGLGTSQGSGDCAPERTCEVHPLVGAMIGVAVVSVVAGLAGCAASLALGRSARIDELDREEARQRARRAAAERRRQADADRRAAEGDASGEGHARPEPVPVGQVEVFADVRCPASFLVVRRLAEERRHAEAPPIRVRAWPLDRLGTVRPHPERVERKVRALRKVAGPDAFPGFDAARWPTTSLPAFALIAAAYDVNDRVGEAIVLAIGEALWDQGADISSPGVLARLAGAHGLATITGARGRIEADERVGAERGISSVPCAFDREEVFRGPALDLAVDADADAIRRDLERLSAFLDRTFG